MSVQLEPRAIPSRLWDVTVIGAGPAGSIAATMLARKGWSVLMLDKFCFPRDKVCGDGLIADAAHCLARLGILETVDRFAFKTSQSAVFSPSRYEVRVPGEYRTLKRFILDDLLAGEAVTSGAVFAQGHVSSIERADSERLTVRFREREEPVFSRVTLVATGVDTRLLNAHGMVQRGRHSAVAIRAYVESPVDLDRLIVSYDRSIIPGYAWIFPMGGGEFNVGCGVFYRGKTRDGWNLKEMLGRFLSDFPLARHLMARGRFMTPLRGAPLRCALEGTSPYRGGGILAIGETIGATFPFTGEGIGKAMETGELAASTVDEALRSGDLRALARFPERLRAHLLPRYRGYRIAEDWLSIPWLNDFIARRAQRSAFMRDALAGIINETVDPETVFSIRGLARSFRE